MDSVPVSLLAVGDVAPAWPNPDELFELALPTFKQADILFGNCEAPVCEEHELQRHNYYPRRIPPNKASTFSKAGFHVMSFANNHTLDSGENGLFETLDALRKVNIMPVGAGRNITEARTPAIIERKGVRVAFLGYCTVLPKGCDATAQRSGCAPMRATTFYEQVDWQPGTPPKIISLANQNDLAAMVEDIAKVRLLADVVVLSIHWGIHIIPAMIAMYQQEVARAAIDAGVDLILGHHAHILKGAEVYKGKVIFYSMGNFIMPNKGGSESKVMYKVPKDPEYPFYGYPVDSRKTIIVKAIIGHRAIERVSFLPAFVNKTIQTEVLKPADSRFAEVVNYMTQISETANLNARFRIDGSEVIVGV